MAANDNAIRVFIDNTEISFNESDGTPFLDANGRSQVPLRRTMEAVGVNVLYDDSERCVSLLKDDINAQLFIGNPLIHVNESVFRLETVPVIVQGRTYVPLRFILEQFGYSVEWNGDEMSVRIAQTENSHTGWSGPWPSFGPHGYSEFLGFEVNLLLPEVLAEAEFLGYMQRSSAAFKNNGDQNTIIEKPVSIVYEVNKISSNGAEELMCKFVFNMFTGELPAYSVAFHDIPYSGWTVAKGQYRITIVATAPFVYFYDGETISNTLEEIARYHYVEKLFTVK